MKARGPHYRVAFRRRREGRTDYRLRMRLLRGGRPRAVVRKTLTQTLVQIVESGPEGDRILASACGADLKEAGWPFATGNVPAAYLTGFLAGRRARRKGISSAVLDIGLHEPTKGGRVFAALKGLLDAGLDVPHDEGILPSPERLRGEHISESVPTAFETVKGKLEAG